ncbi:hypothetical protein CCAX7_31240 [Capsulimonas corticalis]|uniref:Uncharacterized protein n=1 Tax=Capsulimonas corticalis TaxID=2219043 RepID=A0A402CSJ1_9BACT|nr:hypothetical protein CCAX7_31240 [Capsulimonas corticalis]
MALGSLAEAATAAKRALDQPSDHMVLIFDAVSGEQIDLNLHGTLEDVLARLQTPACDDAPAENAPEEAPRAPGRPKLGVVPREVTLLPRHWDWLASQSGGASVALRKLVEKEMRAARQEDHKRQLRDAAYRFMSAIAGNETGFEEALRALFAVKRDAFHHVIQNWPRDIREHTEHLADQFFDADSSSPAS